MGANRGKKEIELPIGCVAGRGKYIFSHRADFRYEDLVILDNEGITALSKWETQASSTISLLEQRETALKGNTPSELSELFYSSEAYDIIVKGTMPYAADIINEQEFLTTADEIRVFIGTLLLTLVIIQIPVNVIIDQMLRPWHYHGEKCHVM
ncbi:hypothetical protein TNCV_4502871 [Trichonephila clavipes]|nr:hypothetical protein TNCV_4502871 [Trichonephila clavipes]